MVGRVLLSIVQYSFYTVRKRRQDNISKEKAAPPQEVERLMRLVLDVKRGVLERIQDTRLILGADAPPFPRRGNFSCRLALGLMSTTKYHVKW